MSKHGAPFTVPAIQIDLARTRHNTMIFFTGKHLFH